MSKKSIIAAAKKRGLTVESLYYGWTVTPGERVPGWEVQFGPEIDQLFAEEEIQYFDNSNEAVEWIGSLHPLPAPPEVP
ncbi:TPA: hypothetical protein QDZ75_004183 [Stenotrophomonas maltophilia]|nr:hypothetical protein [Stenotrophomonas maltophilia]